jgi:hypothetical protein
MHLILRDVPFLIYLNIPLIGAYDNTKHKLVNLSFGQPKTNTEIIMQK